jgi:hypothetical protein
MPAEMSRRDALKTGLFACLGLGFGRDADEEIGRSIGQGHYTALYDVPWNEPDPFLDSLIGTVNSLPLLGMPIGTILYLGRKREKKQEHGRVDLQFWYRPDGWGVFPSGDHSSIEAAWRARDD